MELIHNLKDDTVIDHDKILVKLFKHIAKFINHPLIYIYNLSLKNDNCYITVILVYNNYWSITLISNFSKILEKIVKSRLITLLESYILQSRNQFDFRPGLGKIDTLYKVNKLTYDALHNNKKAIAVFLDYSKAFNTVDHKELLKTMLNFEL